ncbi:MAG: hypothetical protein NTX75_14015 [Proteobacteria bacterium]|nr:hypothetical protein [Pseudomonadota bacterium]
MLEEKDVCCSGNVKTLILACSGGSNVGQISNNVMIELGVTKSHDFSKLEEETGSVLGSVTAKL